MEKTSKRARDCCAARRWCCRRRWEITGSRVRAHFCSLTFPHPAIGPGSYGTGETANGFAVTSHLLATPLALLLQVRDNRALYHILFFFRLRRNVGKACGIAAQAVDFGVNPGDAGGDIDHDKQNC